MKHTKDSKKKVWKPSKTKRAIKVWRAEKHRALGEYHRKMLDYYERM